MKKSRIALTLDQVKKAFEGLSAGGGNYCVFDEYEQIDKEEWKTPTMSKLQWPPPCMTDKDFNCEKRSGYYQRARRYDP